METSSIGRIPIVHITPSVLGLARSPKAFVGEVVPFSAVAFREGHDIIGVALNLKSPEGNTTRHQMTPVGLGTDRWEIEALVDVPGRWRFTIEAYADDYATWHHNAEVKIPLGIDVELMFTMGSEMFTRASKEPSRTAAARKKLAAIAALLADTALSIDERWAAGEGAHVDALLANAPIASLDTFSPKQSLRVERTLAGRGSWYEFFPRSEGAKKLPDGSWQSGTFRTAAKRLPAVAAMGFDVLYLPPIHPIGTINRKGPNNTLTPAPGDPGSPCRSADAVRRRLPSRVIGIDHGDDARRVAAPAGRGGLELRDRRIRVERCVRGRHELVETLHHALEAYLAFNSIPHPLTIFRGTAKLPPGQKDAYYTGTVTFMARATETHVSWSGGQLGAWLTLEAAVSLG